MAFALFLTGGSAVPGYLVVPHPAGRPATAGPLHPIPSLPRQPRSPMSIQTLGRYGVVLFLAELTSGCSLTNECRWNRSSCMYDGKYEPGEEDYAESEAKRLNKASTDRLRRSSGD